MTWNQLARKLECSGCNIQGGCERSGTGSVGPSSSPMTLGLFLNRDKGQKRSLTMTNRL